MVLLVSGGAVSDTVSGTCSSNLLLNDIYITAIDHRFEDARDMKLPIAVIKTEVCIKKAY